MKMLNRFTFLVILLASISNVSYAQNGTIRGTLIDESTGEPIYGGSVFVVGTSAGTTTDFDGKFDLKITEGTHQIRFSYISYRSLLLDEVNVERGELLVLGTVALQKNIEEMDEIVVTASIINTSEAAMISIKRNSINMIDGISSERFRAIGDSDAANALKRVTGVSVEDGKYVYVRGLGDRYSKTILNSVDIPSLDPDKNSLQIDIFPTNLIDNMVITKTAVAELPADFSGGIVNIETKDFPEEPIFDLSISTNYNPTMHFESQFLNNGGNSTNFLGFDSGSRKLPIGAGESNIPTPISGTATQDVNNFVNSFDSNLGPTEKINPMDISLGLSLGNQFNIGGGRTLGYVLTGTYKRSSSHYENYRYGEYQTQPSADAFELIYATNQVGNVSETNVLAGGLAGLALKTERSKYKLTGMHLRNGENHSSNFFVDNSKDAPGQSGYLADAFNLEYSERAVTNFMLNGVHYFDDTKWEVNWRVSPTFSSINDPDVRTSSFTLGNQGEPTFNAGAGGFPSRIWRNMDEVNLVARADVTRDYLLFGDPAKIKFGTNFTFKERDYEILAFNMQFFGRIPELTGDPNDILDPENIYPNGTIYYQSGNNDPNPNGYNSNIENLAFYFSNEFQLFSNLKTSIGLRAENYVQKHTGRDALFAQGGNGNNLDNEKVLDALDFFPSVNLTYFASDRQNFRASYSRTIARPSFKELSFAQILDPVSDRIFNGGLFPIGSWDGNLKETRIDNFDTRWEMFFDKGQLLSVSLFYKMFDDPIELVRIQVQATSSEFQPRNVGDGRVLGAELEFRKNLGFIAEPLTYFHINSNITIVESVIDMTDQEFEARLHREKVGESVGNTRQMAGQAPFMINAGLQYDNPGLGFDAGFFYNLKGETLAVVGGGLFPDVYATPFHNLRFNLNKKLGRNNQAALNLSVSNLLNETQEELYKGFNAVDQIFSSYKPGRAVNLGIKYTF